MHSNRSDASILTYICSVHIVLLGKSINLPLSPQSLWSFKNMTNTWRIQACQILFGCLNPVADLLFWSLSAWQCVSLTGLFQQGSLGWESIAQDERDAGKMEIYWRGNQWLSCQADACSSHSPSQNYRKGLIVFDYCLGRFYHWKAFCSLMCVSVHVHVHSSRPAFPMVLILLRQEWQK